MKKILAAIGILFTAGLIVTSIAQGDSSPDLASAFRDLFDSLVKVFALFGEFMMKLLNSIYETLPTELHCIFGVLFLAVLVLCFFGLLALKTGNSLWNRVNRYE
jgi:hypothetical protein